MSDRLTAFNQIIRNAQKEITSREETLRGFDKTGKVTGKVTISDDNESSD